MMGIVHPAAGAFNLLQVARDAEVRGGIGRHKAQRFSKTLAAMLLVVLPFLPVVLDLLEEEVNEAPRPQRPAQPGAGSSRGQH